MMENSIKIVKKITVSVIGDTEQPYDWPYVRSLIYDEKTDFWDQGRNMMKMRYINHKAGLHFRHS